MIFMYKNIEVIVLDIVKASIKFLKKDQFSSFYNEGEKHVKILPYLSIVQATEGNYHISIGNGQKFETGEGGFFIAPANVKQTIVHHVNPQSKKMSARWIFLNVEINDGFCLDELYDFPVVINDQQKEQLNHLFDTLFDSRNIWGMNSVVFKILEILMLNATKKTINKPYGVANAISFIAENFTKQITISELAEISHMSKSNFYAAFKKQFGISPISYINHYRLSIAAEKLIESNLSVKEIAFSVGINDSLYFSKLFKKEYGMAPGKYRLMQKNVK